MRYLAFTFLVVFCLTAEAQLPISIELKRSNIGILSTVSVLNAGHSMQKTVRSDKRLKAIVTSGVRSINGPFVKGDSMSCVYQNGRGSDSLGENYYAFPFDTLISFILSPDTIPILHNVVTKTYDARGYLLSLNMPRLDSGKLRDFVRELHNPDAAGNDTMYEEQVWQDKRWQTTYMNRYTYNGRQLASTIFMGWSSNGYVPSERARYIYDDAGQYIGYLSEVLNDSTNSWESRQWQQNYFDSAGRIKAFVWKTLRRSDWDTETITTYHYDISGYLAAKVIRHLDHFGGSGVLSPLDSTTYADHNALGLPHYTSQFIYNGRWELRARSTKNYDVSGNTILDEQEELTDKGWMEHTKRFFFSYNADNRLEEEHSETWDPGQVWIRTTDDYNRRYYYESYSPVSPDPGGSNPHITLYPVPAGNGITLSVQIDQKERFSVLIFDASGKLVVSSANINSESYQEQFATLTWTSGNYFLVINGEHFREVKPFTVLH